MSLLTKFLLGDLFKAAHGRYADNAKNRRLHRVGQEYGYAAREEVPGPGRKPAQQDDEQKNPLAEKLDTLSPTQLSKLVDVSEKKLKEFKDKGYEQGAKKLEEIAREARKRLMGDEAYEKKDLVQRVRDSVSDEKDAGKVEQDWEDRIRDYISEHYPTQANVTAETNSPKGREERERMKNDPELKRMLEQSSREFKEADEREQAEREKKKPVEEKKGGDALDEVQKRFDALKDRIKELKKDSYDGEDMQAIEKQYRSLRRALRKMRKQQAPTDTTTEQPVEKPAQEPKADKKSESAGDDVKIEAQMTFDDIPNSGKVKMAKYLSGARKNKVDSDFKAIQGLDDATVQTLHDGLVKKFNEGFDDMHKADRAEALYKIAKVKNELQKRFNAATKPELAYGVKSKGEAKRKLPSVPVGNEDHFEDGKFIEVDKHKFEDWLQDIGKSEYYSGTKESFSKEKSFNEKLADRFEEHHPAPDSKYIPDRRFTVRDQILSSNREDVREGVRLAIVDSSRNSKYEMAMLNKALIEKGYQPVVRADMYHEMTTGKPIDFAPHLNRETLMKHVADLKSAYKKLPKETQEAMRKYTGSGWRSARYEGDTSMNKPLNDYVRSTPLKEDIVLMRGLTAGSPKANKFIETIMNTPIGGTYKADGFSSFSANKMVTSFGNAPFKISMVGKKGQKIAPLYRKGLAEEMEYIPPTDSTFRVLQKGLGSVVVELVDE